MRWYAGRAGQSCVSRRTISAWLYFPPFADRAEDRNAMCGARRPELRQPADTRYRERFEDEADRQPPSRRIRGRLDFGDAGLTNRWCFCWIVLDAPSAPPGLRSRGREPKVLSLATVRYREEVLPNWRHVPALAWADLDGQAAADYDHRLGRHEVPAGFAYS